MPEGGVAVKRHVLDGLKRKLTYESTDRTDLSCAEEIHRTGSNPACQFVQKRHVEELKGNLPAGFQEEIADAGELLKFYDDSEMAYDLEK